MNKKKKHHKRSVRKNNGNIIRMFVPEEITIGPKPFCVHGPNVQVTQWRLRPGSLLFLSKPTGIWWAPRRDRLLSLRVWHSGQQMGSKDSRAGDSVRTVSWSGDYGRPTASMTGVPAPYRKISHASEAGPLLSGILLKMHKGIIVSPLSLS